MGHGQVGREKYCRNGEEPIGFCTQRVGRLVGESGVSLSIWPGVQIPPDPPSSAQRRVPTVAHEGGEGWLFIFGLRYGWQATSTQVQTCPERIRRIPPDQPCFLHQIPQFVYY